MLVMKRKYVDKRTAKRPQRIPITMPAMASVGQCMPTFIRAIMTMALQMVNIQLNQDGPLPHKALDMPKPPDV